MSRLLFCAIVGLSLTGIAIEQAPPTFPATEIAKLGSGVGNCTGVRFRTHFVVTAQHCVTAPDNFVTVKLAGGAAKQTKILAKNNKLKLGVVCAPQAGGSIDIAASKAVDKQAVTVVDEGRLISGRVFGVGGVRFGVDPNPVNQSLCSGDSGGPAFTGNELYGILDQAKCSESGVGFYYWTNSDDARKFLDAATNAAKQKECASS